MTTAKNKEQKKQASKRGAPASEKKKTSSRQKKDAAKAKPEETLPPVDDRYLRLQADFDNTIVRSPKNDQAYAQLIRTIVDEHDLKAGMVVTHPRCMIGSG